MILLVIFILVVLLAVAFVAGKTVVRRAIKLNAFKGAAFWLSGGLMAGIFVLIGFMWGCINQPDKEVPRATLLIDQSGSMDDSPPCKVPALR
ncbi:MAG: hypothetical protein K2X93_12365 [Candidatus Obscuribacterales bacterium]|nr:hypothetical protein [Candidatus Obscuribacterales bacterium]